MPVKDQAGTHKRCLQKLTFESNSIVNEIAAYVIIF